MSNRNSSRGPRDKNISFDQAVDWAKKNINADREKHTWDSKFWYVVCGIIVLIILLGLVYIYYWRKKSIPIEKTESILDTINQQANKIVPVSIMTPRTPINQIPSTNDQQIHNNGPSSNFNSVGDEQFIPPNHSQAPVMSPGGSFIPAISSSGNLKGMWFYPKSP